MTRKRLLMSLTGPALLLVIAVAFGLMSMQHEVGTKRLPGPAAFPLLIASALAAFSILGARKSGAMVIRYAPSSPSQAPSGRMAERPPSLPVMPVLALLLFFVLITSFSLTVAAALTALTAVSPFRHVSRSTRLLTAAGIAAAILLGYYSDNFVSHLLSSLTL